MAQCPECTRTHGAHRKTCSQHPTATPNEGENGTRRFYRGQRCRFYYAGWLTGWVVGFTPGGYIVQDIKLVTYGIPEHDMRSN